MLINDQYGNERLSRLDPHLYVMDVNKPRSLSSYMSLPSPLVAAIASWMHEDSNY